MDVYDLLRNSDFFLRILLRGREHEGPWLAVQSFLRGRIAIWYRVRVSEDLKPQFILCLRRLLGEGLLGGRDNVGSELHSFSRFPQVIGLHVLNSGLSSNGLR